MALLHSTWLYITLPWLYFTPLDSTLLYHGSTSLYLTIYLSTIALLHSISLYTLVNHSSTSLCLTLHYSIMALLHSTNDTLLYHSSISLSTTIQPPVTIHNQIHFPLHPCSPHKYAKNVLCQKRTCQKQCIQPTWNVRGMLIMHVEL